MYFIIANIHHLPIDFIKDYLSNAGKHGDSYFFVNEIGSPPAALVNVKNTKDDSIVEGWICSGSFRYPYEALKISDDFSIVMTVPEPKKFSSNKSKTKITSFLLISPALRRVEFTRSVVII